MYIPAVEQQHTTEHGEDQRKLRNLRVFAKLHPEVTLILVTSSWKLCRTLYHVMVVKLSKTKPITSGHIDLFLKQNKTSINKQESHVLLIRSFITWNISKDKRLPEDEGKHFFLSSSKMFAVFPWLMVLTKSLMTSNEAKMKTQIAIQSQEGVLIMNRNHFYIASKTDSNSVGFTLKSLLIHTQAQIIGTLL